jgi:hypothetical protein
MMPTDVPFIHYVLETQNAGVDIRVLLNGAEIVRGVPADKKITQEKINGWLVGGQNKVQIYASVTDPEKITGQVHIKCLLFRGPMGEQPDESKALLRFEQDDKMKLPNGAMQMVWQETFTPEPFYGPWVWETSAPIVPGPVSERAALGVLTSAIVALNAHDGEAVVKLFTVYLDEVARAYHGNAERQKARMAGMADAWTVVPMHALAAENYAFHYEENQKLLRVDRKDGLPLFTEDVKSPGIGPQRVYLANTPLGWTIVR